MAKSHEERVRFANDEILGKGNSGVGRFEVGGQWPIPSIVLRQFPILGSLGKRGQ